MYLHARNPCVRVCTMHARLGTHARARMHPGVMFCCCIACSTSATAMLVLNPPVVTESTEVTFDGGGTNAAMADVLQLMQQRNVAAGAHARPCAHMHACRHGPSLVSVLLPCLLTSQVVTDGTEAATD